MPVAATLPAGAVETVTFNQVEVRKWGTGNSEVITTYPHPNIRLIWTKGTAGVTLVEEQALHRDQLGSVRAVTTFKPLVAGAALSTLRREAAIYKPFGEMTEVLQPTQVNQEQKGWIGERYDADAGLQYLNARYYDPELGFFLQPDWFEVTALGVGTNRYSYAGNDPINQSDPGGNNFGDFITGLFAGNSYVNDTYRSFAESAAQDLEDNDAAFDANRIDEATYLDRKNIFETAYETALARSEMSLLGHLFDGALQTAEVLPAYGGLYSQPAKVGIARINEGAAYKSLGIGATGKLGERVLIARYGGAGKFFPTSKGPRFVDVFAGGVAHESKVGYVTASSLVKSQIAKDAELLSNMDSGVTEVVWHFFRSPVSGTQGPAKTVTDLLDAAKIRWTVE